MEELLDGFGKYWAVIISGAGGIFYIAEKFVKGSKSSKQDILVDFCCKPFFIYVYEKTLTPIYKKIKPKPKEKK